PQDAWGYIAGTVDLTDRQLDILRALYRAELAYLDRRLGELRRHLEAAGKFDDTVFVVTGDHGENIGDHGLMDHQYSLYETLLHVPLIVHGPGFETGQVDDLVQLTDLAPTLLDAADIDAPTLRDASQGQSFHPEVETPSREYAIAEYMAPQPSMDALRERVGTLTDDVERFDRSLRAIRTDDEKLIRGSDGTQKFYELQTDPEEAMNLATERSEQVDTLETTLDEWLDTFEHADASGEVSMSDATEARLEDLGYIQ